MIASFFVLLGMALLFLLAVGVLLIVMEGRSGVGSNIPARGARSPKGRLSQLIDQREDQS